MAPQNPIPVEGEEAEVRDQVTEPPLYRVLLHNDDFTTKEFVVEMLVAVFNKSPEEAAAIMWHTHRNGIGLCGVFTYEVAETKVQIATEAAREHGFPLLLTIEPEE
jgi:ATP-dependent Clp protease adaptor protein ClpS